MGFVNFDRNSEFTVKRALGPAAQFTTAQNGLDVDTGAPGSAAQAKTVTFVMNCGAVTDGTIDFTVEESDTGGGSGYTAIHASRVFGNLSPGFTSSTDDTAVAISVKPAKRYVRINTVETVASAGYYMSGTVVMERF